jgi:CDP-glycerol glycerophosphotransferase (TagB/SpsB family)
MVKLGAPEEQLIITGMPSSDKLFERSRQKLSLSQDAYKNKKKICLILSDTSAMNFEPEMYANYRTLVKKLFLENDCGVQWIIKLHPIEEDKFYKDIGVDSFKNVLILPKSTSLEDALELTTFACTLYSTAGLEAMIVQKPLFILNVHPRVEEFAWWPRYGGGLYIYSAEELLSSIDKFYESNDHAISFVDSQNIFLEKCYENRGTSAQKIHELLKGKNEMNY